MVNSGTEATMSAVRLARAATGRERVVKFAGAYHGHVDGLLAEAGSGLATQGIPASPGVPEAQAAATIVVGWNDLEAVEAALAEHEVAAILAEPIPANMGVVPPDEGFLAALRRLADEHGALLVLDEVISGFRVARGGAQELLGVRADLTIMGKVIGGGLPAAAYGGRRDLLARVAPAGDVYQAGTLSGNPLAVAAGLATLAQLDRGAYERLGELTELLAAGLREAAGDSAVQVASVPGLVTPFFSRRAGARLRRRRRLRPGRLRALLPGAARSRDLPARVAVRGLVRLARPRRGGDRAHRRRGRGGVRARRCRVTGVESNAEEVPDEAEADRTAERARARRRRRRLWRRRDHDRDRERLEHDHHADEHELDQLDDIDDVDHLDRQLDHDHLDR